MIKSFLKLKKQQLLLLLWFRCLGPVKDFPRSDWPVMARMAKHQIKLVALMSPELSEIIFKTMHITWRVTNESEICWGKRAIGRTIRTSTTPLIVATRTNRSNLVSSSCRWSTKESWTSTAFCDPMRQFLNLTAASISVIMFTGNLRIWRILLLIT